MLFPLGERAVVVLELDTASVVNQTAFLLVLQVLIAVVLGEAPLLRDEDLEFGEGKELCVTNVQLRWLGNFEINSESVKKST